MPYIYNYIYIYIYIYIYTCHIYILGPLLFIIFINDISNIFNNEQVNNININLYADDTSITIFAENDTLLTYYLQYYMDK